MSTLAEQSSFDMPLGFDPSLALHNPIDREYRQFMASSLQQLGKQVSEGIKQVAMNRQLKQMGDELKQVSPDSPYFPQEMVGIVTRYPLAVSDRRGVVALNLLGNSHKNWLTQQYKSSQAQRAQKPIVRNFSDKTTRQYNQEKNEWEVITEGDPLPSKEKKPTFAQETKAEELKSLLDLRTKEEKFQALADDARNKYGADSEVTQQIDTKLKEFRAQIPKRAPSKGAIMRHLDVFGKRFGPAINGLGAGAVMPVDELAISEEMPLKGGGPSIPFTAQAVQPEALIPVQPTAAVRKRYNPQTDTFE